MPLSINDGKATPVAHVFTQDNTQNGDIPAEYVNRSNTNGPTFWERIRAACTLGRKASQPHVYKYSIVRPIPGVKDGLPVVLGKHVLIQTLLVDQTVSTESDILDTVAMGANLLDNTNFRAQVKSLAPSTHA